MADEKKDSEGEARQSFFAKQQLLDSARTAFQQMSAVMRNVSLYPEEHPFLITSADKLLKTIEALLLGRKDVAFYMVGGELFFETLAVPIEQSLSLLLEQFVSRDIGGIVFKPGLTSQELARFAGLMSKEPSFLVSAGGLPAVLAKQEITHIELHRVLLTDKKVAGAMKEGVKKSTEIYQDALNAVKEMVQSIHLDKTANLRKMNAIVQTMVDNVLDNRDSLVGLTSLKMYDEYTYAHSVNVSILCVSLGTFLSFEKPQISILGAAGLMHDIGKVTVPHEVINKPGKLTDDEWEQVKRHPVEGALLLSDTPGLSKLAMVAAYEHHQHGDVRGYPPVEGELKQHPFSQVVSIADAYEALTAARVYYSAQMPPDNAMRILIAKRGVAFNPVLVKAFVNMIGIFPIGALLKLDTGEIGLVLHQTRDLMRPRVLLLTAFDGSESNADAEVSLLETAGGRYKRSVVGTIDPNAAKINLKKYMS
jgi:HD-GYP domain-containing protein (c-di-GMP phosphodiesterase class II)